MLYKRRKFTLPASDMTRAASSSACAEHGHMEPDRRGRCYRCGERVELALHPSADDTVATMARLRGQE